MRPGSVLLALLLSVFGSQCLAASFDCGKAASYAEKEICRDGYLSSLDDWLARSYSAALKVNDSQADAVRQSQREWLATRNACQTQKCLDQAIGERIKVLDNYVSAERIKASQAETARNQQAQAQRQAEADNRSAAQRQAESELQAAREQQRRLQEAQAARDRQAAASPVSHAATAPSVSASESYTSELKSAWQRFVDGPAWKYLLVTLAALTLWAMWRHHQGVTTIYNDYTDAALTNLLPVAGVALGALLKWLELPRELATVAAFAGSLLAVLLAIYASIRTNQGVLNMLLSLVAKLTLVSVFYAIMALLIASLFANGRRQGESQARADARNRRQNKQTMALIGALASAYTFLSAWLCRNQEFTSLAVCLEFEQAPDAT